MILDLQEHILKRLPRNARAGTARLLCCQFAILFEDEITIYTKDADLPDEVLQRWYLTLTNSERTIVMDVRTGAGDLRHVQWLRQQDPSCPLNGITCVLAAWKGHLKVLKWLRAQDPPYPWDENTCMYAADGGHLEVMKWLRAQDPPCFWNGFMCTFAAATEGHLEVLQWLRAQEPPCPWNRYGLLMHTGLSDEIRSWISTQV